MVTGQCGVEYLRYPGDEAREKTIKPEKPEKPAAEAQAPKAPVPTVGQKRPQGRPKGKESAVCAHGRQKRKPTGTQKGPSKRRRVGGPDAVSAGTTGPVLATGLCGICCSARSGTAMDLGPDYFRVL